MKNLQKQIETALTLISIDYQEKAKEFYRAMTPEQREDFAKSANEALNDRANKGAMLLDNTYPEAIHIQGLGLDDISFYVVINSRVIANDEIFGKLDMTCFIAAVNREDGYNKVMENIKNNTYDYLDTEIVTVHA